MEILLIVVPLTILFSLINLTLIATRRANEAKDRLEAERQAVIQLDEIRW